VLLAWQILTRAKWHADADALLGMAAESVLWTIPLVALHALTWKLFSVPALTAGDESTHLAVEILTGIGAGVYEEFLFRLAAISLLLLVSVDVLRGAKRPMVAVAVVLTSVLFSLYHFIGPESFDGYKFVFRAAAGAYLAGLYILRGFGVAVGAHACYNVAVALT
jgi:membrane protease YdiL (CAAX protease family)